MDMSTWAKALTNERLGQDLRRLAENIRFHSGPQRSALLDEAATRLEPAQPTGHVVRGYAFSANADGSLFITFDGHKFLLERDGVNTWLNYVLRLAVVEMRPEQGA